MINDDLFKDYCIFCADCECSPVRPKCVMALVLVRAVGGQCNCWCKAL